MNVTFACGVDAFVCSKKKRTDQTLGRQRFGVFTIYDIVSAAMMMWGSSQIRGRAELMSASSRALRCDESPSHHGDDALIHPLADKEALVFCASAELRLFLFVLFPVFFFFSPQRIQRVHTEALNVFQCVLGGFCVGFCVFHFTGTRPFMAAICHDTHTDTHTHTAKGGYVWRSSDSSVCVELV